MDALIHLGMYAVDVLFFAGLIGAAIVVILSFVEDCADILDEK